MAFLLFRENVFGQVERALVLFLGARTQVLAGGVLHLHISAQREGPRVPQSRIMNSPRESRSLNLS